MPRSLTSDLSLASLAAGALLLAACGSAPPAPTPAPSSSPASQTAAAPPPARRMDIPHSFDPVAQGLTVDGIRGICDEHLANARTILAEIDAQASLPEAQLTYASTLGRFDDMITETDDAGWFPALMGEAHPDKAVRAAGKECEPKTQELMTAVYLDATLARVMRAYASKHEALDTEQARLLHDLLRDFRRNGLELPEDKQQRLRALDKEITAVGQRFTTNIAESTDHLYVTPKQLADCRPTT